MAERYELIEVRITPEDEMDEDARTMRICHECGCLVVDRYAHDRWHDRTGH